MVVTEASDVFMLGCTFIEVLTGCGREPYDWLMTEDPSGTALTVYRGHESTRNNNPLVVRVAGWERCVVLRPDRVALPVVSCARPALSPSRRQPRRANTTCGQSIP